jgi:hypothetical protein
MFNFDLKKELLLIENLTEQLKEYDKHGITNHKISNEKITFFSKEELEMMSREMSNSNNPKEILIFCYKTNNRFAYFYDQKDEKYKKELKLINFVPT